MKFIMGKLTKLDSFRQEKGDASTHCIIYNHVEMIQFWNIDKPYHKLTLAVRQKIYRQRKTSCT